MITLIRTKSLLTYTKLFCLTFNWILVRENFLESTVFCGSIIVISNKILLENFRNNSFRYYFSLSRVCVWKWLLYPSL